jgi:Dullard-like phosphatase family protein
MNSLQYISTQVDRVIGQPDLASQQLKPAFEPVIDEEEPEEDYKDEKDDETLKQQQPSTWPVMVIRTLLSVLIRGVSFMFLARRTRHPVGFLPNKPNTQTPGSGRQLQSPYVKSHQQSLSATIAYARHLPPPRPLLSKRAPLKTLVLDLDETLIHSLARGAKFSAGQMVEVKLDSQFATLYFVNKRPDCDQFLKCVSEWFRLVVFTASVPAYADPMIDWLEQDRKYFSQRFYRHHCTSTPQGYIKDLSRVESDLSRVIIIDNSPVSYSMHQENAISIEGWISDPSDHSLLHLIPLLHALRYSVDVRSLVSLKMGEAAFD